MGAMEEASTIRGPEEPPPAKFAEAYAELQAIAARLKPEPGKIPDVRAFESEEKFIYQEEGQVKG